MEEQKELSGYNAFFFIGIAGAGMSALAIYLVQQGKKISGSDRNFDLKNPGDVQEKLMMLGIVCFLQDGSGINDDVDVVIASTAIEDTVPDVKAAKDQNIPLLKRSDLLAMISDTKKTIAIAGTSGKSTTAAMVFHILEYAGKEPGVITGAGLTSLIKKGELGNAKNGAGEWLVIEADESDGSVVKYHPEIGVLLNVDKDHQDIDELMDLFETFKKNTRNYFIVNRENVLSAKLSANAEFDFGKDSGTFANDYIQNGYLQSFTIDDVSFTLKMLGEHNMQNALAAVASCRLAGVALQTCAEALQTFEGIYRRHQVFGEKNRVILVDDYAHNPAKCAASIKACSSLAPKVIAWFQPHGYQPTRFLKDDFIKEIAAAVRSEDEIWMSEIYYAGGTAVKDISANDLVEGIKELGKNAFFVEDRNEVLEKIRPHFADKTVLLLMGARDPSLEMFAQDIWEKL